MSVLETVTLNEGMNKSLRNCLISVGMIKPQQTVRRTNNARRSVDKQRTFEEKRKIRSQSRENNAWLTARHACEAIGGTKKNDREERNDKRSKRVDTRFEHDMSHRLYHVVAMVTNSR